ncbi:MAG: hypothetical protein QXV06_01255 [Ignisphaera sp.]
MIFVAGGGFYGAIAVSKLKNVDIIVVADLDKECHAKKYVECITENIDEVLSSKCRSTLVIGDAAKVFIDLVERSFIPDIVVPAIPRHFAGEVVYSYLKLKGCEVKVYTGVLDKAIESIKIYGVEVKIDTTNGVVIASYMPFNLRCKQGCSEPQICPITGKVKVAPLHELMKLVFSGIADKVIVFESKFIVEGVGGFSGYELTKVLKDLVKLCRGNLVIIVTACACHGLANLFVLG